MKVEPTTSAEHQQMKIPILPIKTGPLPKCDLHEDQAGKYTT